MADKRIYELSTVVPVLSTDYILVESKSGGSYTTSSALLSSIVNSDSQTLSYNEGTKDLSISNGNTVSLSAFLTSETDSQTLTLSGTDLSISNGNTVSLTGIGVNAELIVACSDETTDVAAASGVTTFRMPYAMTLTEVRASLTTAPVGSTFIVDINESGSSILSTALSIDDGEKTSTTAATPAVISDSALADDAEITIDVDQVGSTTAGAGLKVTLIGTRS